VVGLFIVGLDVWGLSFWSAVGASIGLAMSGTAAAAALVLSVILLLDARRQWLLFRPDDDAEPTGDSHP